MNTTYAANELYNPENGILRMFSDLENYIYPIFLKSQPLLYALASIAFIIIPLIAVGILSYLIFYKKYRFFNKFTKRNNYIWWGIALLVYIALSFTKKNIGYDLTLDASRLILPLIAKFFGPYISGIFAVLQYLLMSLINGGRCSILLLLIAAISGMLYGIFFYRKRSRYSRCLGGKIVVNIVCNVFLTTFVLYAQSSHNISHQLTYATIESVLLAPIQAIFIFLLFRLVRFLKHRFAD